jgi:divalent metal cation (Fe/Co/Zn/Cd) transporter
MTTTTATTNEATAAGGGTTSYRAVLTAMAANTGIALAKFVGFALTGSSSMLGEAIHSVADASNQAFLSVGVRRGHAKAWSLVAAAVLLVLSAVTVYEGIEKITHPEPIGNPVVALSILGVSALLEGFSLTTAIRATRASARLKPELLVILCEDSADLVGLAIAASAVVATEITGSAVWDGAGTLAIGALLVAVAAMLLIKLRGTIGETRGWLPETIDRWHSARPGSGYRSDLHRRS